MTADLRRAAPALLATVALTAPTSASAQAPPGPPGPPPATGLPSSPGTAPAFVPPGTPLAIPEPAGPGLLRDTRVAVDDRRFTVPLACRTGGTLRVRARRLAATAIAATRYRCANGRAAARLTLSRRVAARLARRGRTGVTATASSGSARLYFTLSDRRAPAHAKGFWTDGHLQCAPGFLVEPDFTTKATTRISTRGWIAVYSAATGWHWFGSQGENAGRWNAWTATRTGITQFHPDQSATPVPWTLGPITVPAGGNRHAIGVYEIIYWVGGRPDHQWQYVNAGTTGAVAAGSPTHYCVYP